MLGVVAGPAAAADDCEGPLQLVPCLNVEGVVPETPLQVQTYSAR